MSLQTRDRLLGWLKSLRANLPESIEVALDINFNYTNGDLSLVIYLTK